MYNPLPGKHFENNCEIFSCSEKTLFVHKSDVERVIKISAIQLMCTRMFSSTFEKALEDPENKNAISLSLLHISIIIL